MRIPVHQLTIDRNRRGPIAEYGEVWRGRVGTFWTEPVWVTIESLDGLRAVAINKARLASVNAAVKAGYVLPPIEIAITPDGSGGWLVDGNHRLVAARRRGDRVIEAIFTVIGQ